MGTPPDSVEIYCLKCRAKTGSQDVEQVTIKNGRPALRDVCTACGTGKYRIGAVGCTWAGTVSFVRSWNGGNPYGALELNIGVQVGEAVSMSSGYARPNGLRKCPVGLAPAS